jgi:hypothetical protein
LEIGKKGKAILRVTMDRLYGMMRQGRYFKTPVRTQVVRDVNVNREVTEKKIQRERQR